MAIEFDGADDFVGCGSAASIDNLTTRTYIIWANTSDISTDFQPMIEKQNNVAGPEMILRNNGTFLFRFLFSASVASATWQVDLTGIVGANERHMFAVTFDKSLITNDPIMYVDGISRTVVEDDAPSGVFSDDSGQSLNVGGKPSVAGQSFLGNLTEVSVHNTILTATQIKAIYDSRIKGHVKNVASSGLVMYLPMDDQPSGTSADGDTVRDRSTSGNNGTGDNGANNTGLTWAAEDFFSYSDFVRAIEQVDAAVNKTASLTRALISIIQNGLTSTKVQIKVATLAQSIISIRTNNVSAERKDARTSGLSRSIISIITNNLTASKQSSKSAQLNQTQIRIVQNNVVGSIGLEIKTSTLTQQKISIITNSPNVSISREKTANTTKVFIRLATNNLSASAGRIKTASPSKAEIRILINSVSASIPSAGSIVLTLLLESKIETTLQKESRIETILNKNSRMETRLNLESKIDG